MKRARSDSTRKRSGMASKKTLQMRNEDFIRIKPRIMVQDAFPSVKKAIREAKAAERREVEYKKIRTIGAFGKNKAKGFYARKPLKPKEMKRIYGKGFKPPKPIRDFS